MRSLLTLVMVFAVLGLTMCLATGRVYIQEGCVTYVHSDSTETTRCP